MSNLAGLALEEENLDEFELEVKHESMLYDAIDGSSGGFVSPDIKGFRFIRHLISYVADRYC